MKSGNRVYCFTGAEVLDISDSHFAASLAEYKNHYGPHEAKFKMLHPKHKIIAQQKPTRIRDWRHEKLSRELETLSMRIDEAIDKQGLDKYIDTSFVYSLKILTRDLSSPIMPPTPDVSVNTFATHVRALLAKAREVKKENLQATINQLDSMRKCFERMLVHIRERQGELDDRPDLLYPAIIALHSETCALRNELIGISQGRGKLISDEVSGRIRARVIKMMKNSPESSRPPRDQNKPGSDNPAIGPSTPSDSQYPSFSQDR